MSLTFVERFGFVWGILFGKITGCGEGRGLYEDVDEIEILVKQLEDEAGAKDDQVKLLRHERDVGRFAAAAHGAQVDGDDEDSEEADKLGEEGNNEQHVLVEEVDDEVPGGSRR